jgi:ribonuclease BN (tRNA processing enzyme)
MRLKFPGTKGEIEENSIKHEYHTSLIIEQTDTRILVDFGEKHSPGLESFVNSFNAILITHAHPDHYIWTIKEETGITIPVYLTQVAFNYSSHKPLNYKIISAGKSFNIKGLLVTPYNVVHSLRCPAVCFKIKGDKTIIYAPDILDTEEPKEKVFKNVDLIVADGSSVNINLVRRKDDKLFGHAMVKTIMGWCKKYSIKDLIITHCGKQIVTSDEKIIENKLHEYSENKVNFIIAYDGMELDI